MPKITRLSEVATELKELYARQLRCPVKILPDSGPVDVSTLNPEECVLQITFVQPFFEPLAQVCIAARVSLPHSDTRIPNLR